MITVIAWIVLVMGIILSLVCVKGMITDKSSNERLSSFVGGLIYLCVIYLSAYDLFIR